MICQNGMDYSLSGATPEVNLQSLFSTITSPADYNKQQDSLFAVHLYKSRYYRYRLKCPLFDKHLEHNPYFEGIEIKIAEFYNLELSY